MSLDKNNKAYDNLGMSELMKSRIFDRCVERKEENNSMLINTFDASSDSSESREVTTSFLDTSDLVRAKKRSSLYENIMRFVASILVIALLSSMFFFGKGYFNGKNDENIALKNATTEKINDEIESAVYEYNRYDDEYGEEEYERDYREQISSLYGFYSETTNKKGVIKKDDYKKYIDECYDSNGKLKKGYEEKTFKLKSSNDKDKKNIKLVGKDFVVITAEDAKKNYESVKEEFLSKVEDEALEIAKRLCDEYGNKFASYDYVYYIQGDNLLRVRLSEEPETWIYNSLCYKYAKNKYSYSEFIGLKKVDSIVIAFRKKMTVNKKVCLEDKYFNDSNLIEGSLLQLLDKKSEETIKNIKYLHILPAYDSGENILYYVDTNYTLWRIKNVKFYKESTESKEIIEYNHERDCNGQIITSFGVDKDYKAEKIAQNVNVETETNEELAREYYDGFVLKDNIEVSKKSNFKMLIDDEHVIYKESEE